MLDYGACHDSLLRIRALDANVPDIAGLAVATLQASPALYKSAEASLNDTEAALTPGDAQSLGELAAKAAAGRPAAGAPGRMADAAAAGPVALAAPLPLDGYWPWPP